MQVSGSYQGRMQRCIFLKKKTMQVDIPAILISVSEFRVEDPTAVNRLADWSVR